MNNQNGGAPKLTLEKHSRFSLMNAYNTGRNMVLITAIFSLANLVLATFNQGYYFLFCAMVPYFLVLMGLEYTGAYDAEYYAEYYGEDFQFLGKPFLYVMVVMAILIVGIYFLMWFLSKNVKVGFLVAALVMLCLDTLLAFLLFDIASVLLNILIHIFLIYGTVSGVSAGFKLNKLPSEGEEQRVAFEMSDENNNENK